MHTSDEAGQRALATGAPSEVTVEFDVPASMRDGVVLRANVYRPSGDGPWPVLLSRLPYGKDSGPGWLGGVLLLDPVQVARHGFIVVIQDSRGRYASEGEWDPLASEREDGFDSVEWAARLPGSSGRVGMYGGSYFGYTQWAAAGERPPSLAAIAPVGTWSDPMDGLFARGGAVELGITLPWTLRMGANVLERLAIGADERRRRLEALTDDRDRVADQGYWELPITESSVLRRHGVPEIGALRALDDPDVAARARVMDDYDAVAIPTFHVTSWYDMCLQGTLDNYLAMAARGRDARLVVGPWTHDPPYADPIGEQMFGLRASFFDAAVHEGRDLRDLQLAWFRHHLVPDPAVALPEAPIRLFVMGRNEWRSEFSWPPADVTPRRYFLHSEGCMTLDAPAGDEPPTKFSYDPADPVPTLGGHTHLTAAFESGPVDQTRIEARDDVCVFTSEPLAGDLEVTGRVTVTLHVASSAPSTDWVARLCDVHPDGRSINLCDGIVRVASGADELRQFEIDLWATSNVFLAGHRIRVHVTSSSFPRWDRNLNTGDQRSAQHDVAHQQVYHDVHNPSHIELPVRRH